MCFGPKQTAAFLDHVPIWLFLCMIDIWPVFVECMAHWVVSEHVPEPVESGIGQWQNPTSFLVWCHLRAQRSQASNINFSSLSTGHRDFSNFKYFADNVHCRWWDSQSLHNSILRNIILFAGALLLQINKALPIFTSEQFWFPFYIQ